MGIITWWSTLAKCYIFGKFLLPVLIVSAIVSIVIFAFIPKGRSEWHQLLPLGIFCFILTALQFLPEFFVIGLIWLIIIAVFNFDEDDEED